MWKKIVQSLKNGKKESIVICFLTGILLLIIALPVTKKSETADTEQSGQNAGQVTAENTDALFGGAAETDREETTVGQLEKLLTETLKQVDGVGNVTVAITMESTGQKIVEKDVPVTQSESNNQKEDTKEENSVSRSTQETTVYEKKSDGSEVPYIVTETAPRIRGVVIVAEGGADPVIQKNILEAVCALFQVEAHKIKIMKMK